LHRCVLYYTGYKSFSALWEKRGKTQVLQLAPRIERNLAPDMAPRIKAIKYKPKE